MVQVQILLYWDQAAAIVHQLDPRPSQHLRETVDLVNHQLLTYLDPEVYPHRQKFSKASSRSSGGHPLRIPPADNRMFVKLHTGKMSQEMFASLREQGLARAADPGGDPGWWIIESTVANAYMAYLAAAMSGATPGMLPVATSNARSAISPSRTPSTRETRRSGWPMRPSLPRRMRRWTRGWPGCGTYWSDMRCPAPSGPVPAQELRRFKDRHEDRLRRCRHHLDARLAALAKDDPAHRTVQAELLDAIHDDVEVLAEDA